jgi:hypothetical protein
MVVTGMPVSWVNFWQIFDLNSSWKKPPNAETRSGAALELAECKTELLMVGAVIAAARK